MIISDIRRKSTVKYEIDAKIVMEILINLNNIVDEIAETGDKELIAAYSAVTWVLEKFGMIEVKSNETDNN